MNKPAGLHIQKSGLLTLIQDQGRSGFQHLGVPPGGAMDRVAAALANELVGNPADSPVLEITLLGPEIRFEGQVQIALCGADLTATLDGAALPMWESLEVSPGTLLQFGRVRSGCRTYLSVRGNWQVKSWLGSCSPIAGFGQALQKGTGIAIEAHAPIEKRIYPMEQRPAYPTHWTAALYPGPEFERFHSIEIAAFFGTRHRISNQSNRMGYRLEEPIAYYQPKPELLSSGVLPGTVQVTQGGYPIVLMRDAQTTGGYYRLGILPEAELNRLAQAKPGDTLSFEFKLPKLS